MTAREALVAIMAECEAWRKSDMEYSGVREMRSAIHNVMEIAEQALPDEATAGGWARCADPSSPSTHGSGQCLPKAVVKTIRAELKRIATTPDEQLNPAELIIKRKTANHE